jgi:hypothetical protein
MKAQKLMVTLALFMGLFASQALGQLVEPSTDDTRGPRATAVGFADGDARPRRLGAGFQLDTLYVSAARFRATLPGGMEQMTRELESRARLLRDRGTQDSDRWIMSSERALWSLVSVEFGYEAVSVDGVRRASTKDVAVR